VSVRTRIVVFGCGGPGHRVELDGGNSSAAEGAVLSMQERIQGRGGTCADSVPNADGSRRACGLPLLEWTEIRLHHGA
jgi:hypothetical protein